MRRLIVILIFLLVSSSAGAIMVLPMNLDRMVGDSAKIFLGSCLEVFADLDENGIPSTYARFAVKEGLKGTISGESVLIKQFGVSHKNLVVGEGQRALVAPKTFSVSEKAYEPGRDYLLFLYPESSLGFTSPVGGGQGKFDVLMASQGGAGLVVNALDNRFVSSHLGPMDIRSFMSQVRQKVGHD